MVDHEGAGRLADAIAAERVALRAAWFGVPGLGRRSWEYAPLLCGIPGVEADVYVLRFVSATVGRPVPSGVVRALLSAATDELRRRDPSPAWSPAAVEHFVWWVACGRTGMTQETGDCTPLTKAS